MNGSVNKVLTSRENTVVHGRAVVGQDVDFVIFLRVPRDFFLNFTNELATSIEAKVGRHDL